MATLLAMASYGLLWLLTSVRQPEKLGSYDRHVVFLVSLALTGLVIARLVRYIQMLSRRVHSGG